MSSSVVAADIIQAYVMRKMHREKMERMQLQEIEENLKTTSSKEDQGNKNINGGMLGFMKRKVHPNGEKPEETGVPAASR